MACQTAIDQRAPIKLSLLVAPTRVIRINGLPGNSKVSQKSSTHTAEEFKSVKHFGGNIDTPIIELANYETTSTTKAPSPIQVWDSVWNSINMAGWFAPRGHGYADEVIDAILCYLDDEETGSDAPMVLYTCTEMKLNNGGSVGECAEQRYCFDTVCPALAVSTRAFVEAQKHYENAPGVVLVSRTMSKQCFISEILRQLTAQMSIALNIPYEELTSTTLSGFLSLLGDAVEAGYADKVVLVLSGAEHLINTELRDSTADSELPEILSASQLPYRLKPKIKVILACELKATSDKCTTPNDLAMLPVPTLNLKVPSPDIVGHLSACLNMLKERGRFLTGSQISQIHKVFSSVPCGKTKTYLGAAVAMGQCDLSNVASTDVIDVKMLADRILCVKCWEFFCSNLSAFGKEALAVCLALLKITSSTGTILPGLISDELVDLMSLVGYTAPESTPVNALPTEEDGVPVIPHDAAKCSLLVDLISRSFSAKLKNQPVLHSLDGYFVHRLDFCSSEYEEFLTTASLLMAQYYACNLKTIDLQTTEQFVKCTNQLPQQAIHFTVRHLAGNLMKLDKFKYNLRSLRLLPLSFLYSNQFQRYADTALFNLNWLQSKLIALGIESILDDAQCMEDVMNQHRPYCPSGSDPAIVAIRCEVSVLADALRQIKTTLQFQPELLAAGLLSLLLPFSSNYDNFPLISSLLVQCLHAAPKYTVLLPAHTLPNFLRNPLVTQMTLPSSLLNAVSSSTIPNDTSKRISIKVKNDPNIYQYDCVTGHRIEERELSYGNMFSSPNGNYIVTVDIENSDTLKVHQMDTTAASSRVPLIGQINTGLWISAWTRGTPDQQPLKTQILSVELNNYFIGVIARTKTMPKTGVDDCSINSHCSAVSEEIQSRSIAQLASGYLNHLVIFDLNTGKPMQLFSPVPQVTHLAFVQDYPNDLPQRSKGLNEDLYHDLVVTNTGKEIIGFRVSSGKQLFAHSFESASVDGFCFIPGGQKLFAISQKSFCLMQLNLTADGHLQGSCQIPLTSDSCPNDVLLDIRTTKLNSLVLLRGENSINIYDYAETALLPPLTKPSTIPRDFRLPNRKYQHLVFTSAEFVMHEQVVAASIFRHVILWDIHLGVILTSLHISVGILTQLWIACDGYHLVGYVSDAHKLYFWDLNVASNMADRIGCDQYVDACVNEMDRLTGPVNCIFVSKSSSQVLATCLNSDELGVFDGRTGKLTDLYTHEGYVQSLVLSGDARFALLGLAFNSGVNQHRKVNIVWCLATRQVLMEWGDDVGYHIARNQEPSSFFQLARSNHRSERYSLTEIVISPSGRDAENSVALKSVSRTEFPSILPWTTPFMTTNDQHLIALTSDGYDRTYCAYTNIRLLVWTTAPCTEHDATVSEGGKLWFIDTNKLEALSNRSLSVKHILSCTPTSNANEIIIFFSDLPPELDVECRINWRTGSGVNKGILVIQLPSSSDKEETCVKRVILGLPSLSPVSSLHYAPISNSLYDSHQDAYLQFLVSKTEDSYTVYTSFTTKFRIMATKLPKIQKYKFHLFSKNEQLIILSSGCSLYAVAVATMEAVGCLQVYHEISIVVSHPTNDKVIFIGTIDGHVIRCLVADPSRDMLSLDKSGKYIGWSVDDQVGEIDQGGTTISGGSEAASLAYCYQTKLPQN